MSFVKAFEEIAIQYEKTDVRDNMATNGHGIGSEQFGYIIFSKYVIVGVRDGILTSIKMMEVLLE